MLYINNKSVALIEKIDSLQGDIKKYISKKIPCYIEFDQYGNGKVKKTNEKQLANTQRFDIPSNFTEIIYQYFLKETVLSHSASLKYQSNELL